MKKPESYGDLTKLNKCRDLLYTIGRDTLERIANSYLDLLDTSSAIYEVDGSYATALFTSSYCRFLDQASRSLCAAKDNSEALASGKWLCHESCWTEASRVTVETGKPYDLRPCNGGINIYAVPIKAGEKIIGSINIGYGNPPTDGKTIEKLATQYKVDEKELLEAAKEYNPRPGYIIEAAKKHIHTAAELIGEIYSRKKAEERFRAIAEQLPDALFVVDLEDPEVPVKIVEVNDAACTMHGYTRDELIGQSIAMLDDSETAGKIQERNAELLAGETLTFEGGHTRKDGSYFLVDVTARRITLEGKKFAIAIDRDITERRKAEKALKKLNVELESRVAERTAVLESFIYSVSHDLRAPLRAIKGFSRIIARRHRSDLNEEGRHYFDNIVEAGNHMEKLIDDLLSYSRIGHKAIHHEAVPMTEILEMVIKDLTDRISETGAAISLPEDLPTVRGERTFLDQIFFNLLNNALIYRRQDVPLKVAVTWQPEGADAVICVTDNGIGIAHEFHEKIYNIFQRLHGQDEYPGTGIGLAIVRKAAELLGGKVWVESTVGEGSTFCVRLPRAV